MRLHLGVAGVFLVVGDVVAADSGIFAARHGVQDIGRSDKADFENLEVKSLEYPEPQALAVLLVSGLIGVEIVCLDTASIASKYGSTRTLDTFPRFWRVRLDLRDSYSHWLIVTGTRS